MAGQWIISLNPSKAHTRNSWLKNVQIGKRIQTAASALELQKWASILQAVQRKHSTIWGLMKKPLSHKVENKNCVGGNIKFEI